MSNDISLLMDGLILIFLCVTIFYAARLSIFMKSFRQSRGEIAKLIKELNIVTAKAEDSITDMQENAGTTDVAMRDSIVQAKFLSDELRFMTETGDSLANRLEKLADRNRELVDLIENAGGIGTQKISGFDPTAPKSEAMKKRAAPSQPPEDNESDPFDIADFDLEDDEMDTDDEHDFLALGDGAYSAPEKEALGDDEIEENFAQMLHKSNVDMEAKSKVRSFAIFDRDHEDDDEGEAASEFSPHDTLGEEADDVKQFLSRAEQDLYDALQRKKHDFDKQKISETS